METGNLYLIPTLLGDLPLKKVIPDGTLDIIQTIDVFIVEEIRTARRFLKKTGFSKSFDDITFFILNEHTRQEDLSSYLLPAKTGKNTGLLSEAGTPCIADPGSGLVSLAHQSGIRVIPCTGPSSIFLALMASGFNGQNFSFEGYLPAEREKRNRKIKELEKATYEKDQTQIFIETPYRNNQMIQSIVDVCRMDTRLCLAVDLTSANEWICNMTIREWKKRKTDINKRPCVFLLYR